MTQIFFSIFYRKWKYFFPFCFSIFSVIAASFFPSDIFLFVGSDCNLECYCFEDKGETIVFNEPIMIVGIFDTFCGFLLVCWNS
jgi:hypothetical protein